MISPTLTLNTQHVFDRAAQRELTQEEARICAENMFGFIELLHDWHADAASGESFSEPEPSKRERDFVCAP